MAKLENLGKVITADILCLGGGLGGITAALKAKDLDESADVLVVEKDYYGYTGLSTRAGHGMHLMAPEDDLETYIKFSVERNHNGLYLNDQDVLYSSEKDAYTYIDELAKLGAVFAREEDGSVHHHHEMPISLSSSVNIDLDFVTHLTNRALEKGVRILERVYFTDLLKDGDRVVGAVGFHVDTLEFYIFRAKAVILAANGFNLNVGGMFFSGAAPTIAAYEAGAEMRNAEQCVYTDMCFRNTKIYIYGMYSLIFNKNGENLVQKYDPNSFPEDVSTKVLLGMYKEALAGNTPFYIDFTKVEMPASEGEGWNMGKLFPKRIAMSEWIGAGAGGTTHEKPEISLDVELVSQCVRSDMDCKTTVPGLWAVGQLTLFGGSAYGGWTHGDGIGWATRTGLRAAKSSVPYMKTVDLGKIDYAQVERLKERIYAPLKNKGKTLPYLLVHDVCRTVSQPKYNLVKTEETMKECLGILADMRKRLDDLCVPEGDGHHLSKAFEARCVFDMLEIIYNACMTRKESRGPHIRADYPERDDANWLKWVIVKKGKDGKMAINLEDVPFERYKYKPEGWTPKVKD